MEHETNGGDLLGESDVFDIAEEYSAFRKAGAL
jgi:hypothetical protein